MTGDLLARVALSLHGRPDGTVLGAVRALGAAEAWRQRAAALRAAGRPPAGPAEVEHLLGAAMAQGLRFVVPGDDGWPTGFASLQRYVEVRSNAELRAAGRDLGEPFGLWVRGGSPQTVAVGVAVVGSRAASAYGLAVALDLGTGLAERGYDVVSGAAYGIDAAAHRGALAGQGRTIAVLASGADRAYPTDHRKLLDLVAAEGVVVSEAAPGAKPSRGSFLRRNRLIAAMTAGTVLVEAGLRSGARNTMTHARMLGRARLVVPGPVTAASSAGCHATLRGDPEARLVTSAADVVEEVGRLGTDLVPVAHGPLDPRDVLGAIARDLLDLLPPHRSELLPVMAATLGASTTEIRTVCAALAEVGLVEIDGDDVRLTSLGRTPTLRAG